MAVATSLARLRREGLQANPRPDAPTLLPYHLKTSLSERAASARNALQLLSTVDPTLPSYEAPLHLSDISFDRATLSPSSDASLQKAVVHISLRLTPVFLTRPCHSVIEWLLQSLRLPSLGTAQEVDALMLCALPFHQTHQFLALAARLLSSPHAHNWRWLVKSIKSGRFPHPAFCARHAPLPVMKMILSCANSCVRETVSTTPVAALIANVIARRMAVDHDRHALALYCIQLLEDDHVIRAQDEHLSCAILTALATAIAHGVNLTVAQAIVKATALIFSRSKPDSSVSRTAVALLALCQSRHAQFISPKDARMLLRCDILPDSLLCLQAEQRVATYSALILRALASGAPSEKLLRLVGRTLRVDNLFTAESLTNVLERLLEACTATKGDASHDFVKQRSDILVPVLTTLYSGKFADTVDAVLHAHLARGWDRKKKGRDSRMIESSVSRALEEMVSGSLDRAEKIASCSFDILSLSHPDKNVRLKMMQRIHTRENLANEMNEKELETLVSKLNAILQVEHDISHIEAALDIFTKVPSSQISTRILKTVLELCVTKRDSDSTNNEDQDKIAKRLFTLCEEAFPTREAEVQAIFLVLSVEGSFEELLARERESNGDKPFISSMLQSSSEKRDERLGTKSVARDVANRIMDICLEDLDYFVNVYAIAVGFRQQCADSLFQLGLHRLWIKFRGEPNSALLVQTYQRLRSVHGLKPLSSKSILSLHTKIRERSDPAIEMTREFAAFAWTVSTEMQTWKGQEEIISHMVDMIGIEPMLDIIKHSCCDAHRSRRGRRCSLEWYLNFCLVHPCPRIGMEAVVISTIIIYGPDQDLRSDLYEIWARRSALKRKKREKRAILWEFLQVTSDLPSSSTMTVDADSESMPLHAELDKHVSSSNSEKIEMPLSIRTSRYESKMLHAYEGHLVKTLLDGTRTSAENLSILRALSRTLFDGQETYDKLCGELAKNLERFATEGECPASPEYICRLAMIIINSGERLPPKKGFGNLHGALNDSLTYVWSVASQSMSALLAAGLLSLTGYALRLLPQDNDVRRNLLLLLLALGEEPTKIGHYARWTANVLVKRKVIIPELLSLCEKSFESRRDAKSTQRRRQNMTDKDDLMTEKATLGALRSLCQWVSDDKEEIRERDYPWLLSMIRTLWKQVESFQRDSANSSEPVSAVEASSIFSALNVLHRGLSMGHETTHRQASATANVCAVVNVIFLFVGSGSEEVTKLEARDARDAGCDLLEIILQTQESQDVASIAQTLQSKIPEGQTALLLKVLSRILPHLATTESSIQSVVSLVADAAYSENQAFSRERRLKIMGTPWTLRTPTISKLTTSRLCLSAIFEREKQAQTDSMMVAKQCSSFLQDAHLSCVDDVSMMTYMETELDCRIASIHFVNTEFLKKLEQYCEDEDTQKRNALEERLAWLYTALIAKAGESGEDSAIEMVLSSLPMTALKLCILKSLDIGSLPPRVRALRCISERLEAVDVPLHATWRDISGGTKTDAGLTRDMENAALDEAGNLLCNVIVGNEKETNHVKLREAATDLLESLVRCIGSPDFATVQKYGLQLAELLAELPSITNGGLDEEPGMVRLRGRILECLALFVSRLRKNALPLLPRILESSCSILEECCSAQSSRSLKSSREKVPDFVRLTAAAAKALKAVLASCPMFFGGKMLRRIAVLAMKTDVNVPRELLKTAARQVPVDIFNSVLGNSAVFDDKFLNDTSISGLSMLVSGVECGIERMGKSEMKACWRRVLNVILRILDAGREIRTDPYNEPASNERTNPPENGAANIIDGASMSPSLDRFEASKTLDDECAQVLVKVILKLPESDFAAMFNALVQWLDSGSVQKSIRSACEEFSLQVEDNVIRATPFFKIVRRLLAVLKNIMIPYTVLIMGRLVATLRSPIPHSLATNSETKNDSMKAGLKRRRDSEGDQEVATVLYELQKNLREACLSLLVSFFSLRFENVVISDEVAEEIQEALLQVFDDLNGESALVTQSLCGLARIVILPGVSADPKSNQDALNRIVRAVLLRTREAQAELREAALVVCCEMARKVGDEFLTTLPESMPILAEVIDDENSRVAKAAQSYALVVESLAGEPILEQLK